jgi:uncharacterized protein (TIGR02453 family)
MIEKQTFDFLKQLKKHNTKVWFDANRHTYEAAKENIKQNIIQLIPALEKIDATIAQAKLEPKHCSFRINRDVRFSKNKDPYKTNMAMQFNVRGKTVGGAGYYIHIEPGNCFAGGGMYLPMPPDLAKIRQEIDYNFKDFKKLISSKAFTTTFTKGIEAYEALQRPPKGYNENNPALTYLKMKGYIALKQYTDAEMMHKDFVKDITKTFSALQPLIHFINKSLD